MTEPHTPKLLPSPKAAAQMLTDLERHADISAAEEAMGQTDCPEGCYVEPDGHCPHRYQSAGLTAGVI